MPYECSVDGGAHIHDSGGGGGIAHFYTMYVRVPAIVTFVGPRDRSFFSRDRLFRAEGARME